ncbi:hypothetical protein L612_001000001450 [Rhodococcus rhodochrous J38]|uniref:hypothetical protein n=1 Tax=Rhodococcus rhodochrous TaxID=1829 RepID=UPI0011A7CFC0|nr:hypothetical protein [Rhodococcus rhodochrous]TWH63193.1 hypothetical protein L612_001000001450 [Rhodococcus rhodochrous J38]
MAETTYDNATLHLSFSRWEAFMVRRSAMEVPISAITGVEVLPGWTSEILGIRSGMVISGFLKVGTFRHPRGIKRLVAMKRGHPVLRVALGGPEVEFDELLLSSPEAYTLADALRSAGVR